MGSDWLRVICHNQVCIPCDRLTWVRVGHPRRTYLLAVERRVNTEDSLKVLTNIRTAHS